MNADTFDPIAIIGTLNTAKVRYVVIGGVAAGVQGAMWSTTDLDICYARSRPDQDRLAEALAELEARPIDTPAGVKVSLDANTLAAGDRWTLETRFGRLDCFGSPAPGLRFEVLERSARRIAGAETYLVASVDDLIEMKRIAGRPKDLIAVELLRALREEQSNFTAWGDRAAGRRPTGAELMAMHEDAFVAWLRDSGLKTVTTAGLVDPDGYIDLS